jgi:hypothetical protein
MAIGGIRPIDRVKFEAEVFVKCQPAQGSIYMYMMCAREAEEIASSGVTPACHS